MASDSFAAWLKIWRVCAAAEAPGAASWCSGQCSVRKRSPLIHALHAAEGMTAPHGFQPGCGLNGLQVAQRDMHAEQPSTASSQCCRAELVS